MSIAVPAPLPGPTTVIVVNGDEFDILKIPFPILCGPKYGSIQFGEVMDAVIVFPLIVAQQYSQEDINGDPRPVFVVNVNDSVIVDEEL